jgi:nucleotide-binding universal stress UspA family protein
MYKSILVPLDGSRLATGVLPWVRTIASSTRAEIILMSVISPQVVWDPVAKQANWESVEGATVTYLDEQREALASAGFPARTAVRWGEPWQAICECAESERAQLIAMTTHGRSGIRRWGLGSVANKVVHESPIPVLLVSPEEAGPTPEAKIKRILVPIDGSELSQTAIPYAGDFARTVGATVVVVHVVTPFAIAYPGAEAYLDQRAMDQIEANAKEILQRAVDKLRAEGLPTEQVLGGGTAIDGIVAAAMGERTDLIIMSTHGRSGLGRWVLGSVAEAVVRRSHLPCVLHRPEQIRQLRDPASSGMSQPRPVPSKRGG